MAKSNIAILIVNGDINAKFIEQYLKQHRIESEIYCVDGAFDKIKYSDYLLNSTKAIIGDFDSLDCENLKQTYPEIKMLEMLDQDYTDINKSISYLKDLYNKIIIFGVNGGEMDHCLGNISTILHWHKLVKIELVDEFSKAFIIDKEIKLNNVLGKMISVVPLFTAENVTYSGLKYSLKNDELNFMTRIGTRNYAIDDTIQITFSVGILMIFISHKLYHGYLEEIK